MRHKSVQLCSMAFEIITPCKSRAGRAYSAYVYKVYGNSAASSRGAASGACPVNVRDDKNHGFFQNNHSFLVFLIDIGFFLGFLVVLIFFAKMQVLS